MLPRLVESRVWPAAIAQHALGKIAQVPPCTDGQNVVRNILPDVRDDERDSIHDWVFPQASRVGAVERAFENVALFLALRMSKAQDEALVVAGAANRANRAQAVEMSPSHRL
jgi:hypothetical protein